MIGFVRIVREVITELIAAGNPTLPMGIPTGTDISKLVKVNIEKPITFLTVKDNGEASGTNAPECINPSVLTKAPESSNALATRIDTQGEITTSAKESNRYHSVWGHFSMFGLKIGNGVVPLIYKPGGDNKVLAEEFADGLKELRLQSKTSRGLTCKTFTLFESNFLLDLLQDIDPDRYNKVINEKLGYNRQKPN